MTQWRSDDREETLWLGGEAHVRSYDGRPIPSFLRQWMTLEVLPLLAGAAAAGIALGSFGTVGMMKARQEPSRKRIGERIDTVSHERKESMEQGRADDRQVRDDEADAMGAWTILAAFGFGLLAGATVTLLTTPEPGSSVRRRVKRGVDTAREELDEIVKETKESWGQVRDDAREAVKRTAVKMKDAAQATKDALAEDPSSVRKMP
jgi:gas vesicle protein